MTEKLPPLPESAAVITDRGNIINFGFTADQMREYARAAILQEREELDRLFKEHSATAGRALLAERERIARLCEELCFDEAITDCTPILKLAAAIRKSE